MKLFSIYDSASESYDIPRAFPAKGVAIRSVMDAMSAEGTSFALHPTHFSLFYIGDYDTATGIVKPVSPPELVLNLWEMKK